MTNFFKTLIILLSVWVQSILFFTNVHAQDGVDVPVGKYTGSYYNGANFDKLIFTREDSNISFDWGEGSPSSEIDKNMFSIKWSGYSFFEDGCYKFSARSDDGVRVYIDGKRIIDGWRRQAYWLYENVVKVSAGSHKIDIDYFEGYYRAQIDFSYKKVTCPVVPQQTSTTQNGGVSSVLEYDPTVARCVSLEVSSETGTTGEEIKYTAIGYDPDGELGNYEFSLGLINGVVEKVTQEDNQVKYVYKTPGTYNASVRVMSSEGVWLSSSTDCVARVVISGEKVSEDKNGIGGADPKVLVPQESDKLPDTGLNEVVVYGLFVLMGGFGLYIFKRFKPEK